MKKNLLYIITGVFGCLLFSCTNAAINLDPKNYISYESSFSNAARCDLAVIGCYDAAQSGYYPGNNQRRGYPFGAAAVQQGDMRGEDMVNVQAFFAVTYNASYSTTSPNGQALWECTYQMINKINIVIEGVQGAASKNILTVAQSEQYVGELRFLRAMGLHELMIHFALPYNQTSDASHFGVPVSIKPINTIEAVEEAKSAGRATAKATYAQIIEDLDYAESKLPDTRSGGLRISRATKGAAIAAKTRVYQHMYDWGNVVAEAKKIVSDNVPYTSPIGGYKLTDTPEGPFANNSGNTESMWSIENSELDNCTNNGSLSQFYSTVRGLVCVSPIIINADFWLADDLRREQLLLYENKVWWSHKYRARNAMTDWTPVLRYAEVLLNYAEAEARLNGVSEKAVSLLNAVRNRAVTKASDQFTTASFANADALMQAIINERRIEFLGEGTRWSDIHRLSRDPKYAVKISTGESGVPKKVLYANISESDWAPASGSVNKGLLKVAEFASTDTRFLFPIPYSETSSNPKMNEQQNPGWK